MHYTVKSLPGLIGGVPASRLYRAARAAVCAAIAMLTLAASPAWSQSEAYDEINRLVRAKQHAEALSKADQYLASKPRDPQMRFIKGVIQAESGQSTEAIATFAKLTEDYPELPEPYNNLAVLYASQSQFDKARAALEMAIRTNPSYATAHENLGDVYAKLASQAYSKALQLDASGTGAAPKLNLIRSLFAASSSATQPAATVAAAPAAAAPVAAAPVAISPKRPEVPAPVPAAPPSDATHEVESALDAWAKAWSSRKMPLYLAAYSPTFTPPNGQSRSAWEAERRARIVPRSRIGVEISDLAISVDGDQATARFRQAYSSDTLNITSRKTLELVRRGDRWLIARESTGS